MGLILFGLAVIAVFTGVCTLLDGRVGTWLEARFDKAFPATTGLDPTPWALRKKRKRKPEEDEPPWFSQPGIAIEEEGRKHGNEDQTRS